MSTSRKEEGGNIPTRYERGYNHITRVVCPDGQIGNFETSKLTALIGVDRIIRLPLREYHLLRKIFPKLPGFHLGLPIAPRSELEGNTAALLPIMVHGEYHKHTGHDVQPLLSLQNIWIVRILQCVEKMPYDQIPVEWYAQPVGEFSDLPTLQATILNRYLPSQRDDDPVSILNQGISMRMLEPISFISAYPISI